MKKRTKRFLFLTTAAVAGMYTYNRFVANTSTNKNMLPTKNGSYYSWKQGNIFYTKHGSGSPLLLVHDTNAASSSIEWSKIVKYLQKKHTVYTIDLLGCGLSDKPGISYTSYLYVQMITAFIKDVIKEKADIVASNFSSSFIIMANQIDETIINKIILINPASLKIFDNMPDQQSKMKQTILNLPLIGTFIYNLIMNPNHLDRTFRNKYFYHPQLISAAMEDAYYESAHMDNSNGKYLYSSLLGNYMYTDIRAALKNLKKSVTIIGSVEPSSNMNIFEEYKKLNKSIELLKITNCKLYPQLENPEKVAKMILSIVD